MILLLPIAVRAADFKLAFPVDCTLGQDCIVQNYVDLDPGPGWHDYQCGSLSYDGHKGTDFRIRDYRAMADGVAVLASADGVVLGIRNDIHLLKYGFADGPQTLESIEQGITPQVGADAPALVFWANVVGIKKGDTQKVTIRKPDGSLLVSNSQTIEKSRVNWLSYVGKKRPQEGWPKGIYTGVYTIERDGVTIIGQESLLRID